MKEYSIEVKRGTRVHYGIDGRSVSLEEFEASIRGDVRRSTRPYDEAEALETAREITANLQANGGRVTFFINPNPGPPMPPMATYANVPAR